MTEETITQSGGKRMKMFLLLAVGSVATAGALPSLPAKIILSAFVLLAVLMEATRRLRKNRKKNLQFILEQ
jgi:hypothetical protein